MDSQTVWQQKFDFFAQKPIVVEPAQAHLSTDAGLLPIRQLDEALGLTEQFAAALLDQRDGPALRHTYLEMARMRVYGILAGYEDSIGIRAKFRSFVEAPAKRHGNLALGAVIHCQRPL